jgi:hypothetical protein
MTGSERDLLTDLRRTLLHLHKTLLEWERTAYEKFHGRVSGHELLHATLNDPQFAWLRPVSELIVRIDETLEAERVGDAEMATGGNPLSAILSEARRLVAPDEGGTRYGQRYHTALQEHPDAVLAHRDVADVLKRAPEPERRTH